MFHVKMSDLERKKAISNKSRPVARASLSGSKSFSNMLTSTPSKEKKDSSSEEIKQPTILSKNRETVSDESTLNFRGIPKENDASLGVASRENPGTPFLKYMKQSIKLIDDGIINTEHLQDYLQENNNFLVIGVIGGQGVGKSTLLNMLTETELTEKYKQKLFKLQSEALLKSENDVTIPVQYLEDTYLNDDLIFKAETIGNVVNCTNATEGIDIYVSADRVIFLDCQPILSVGTLVNLLENNNKRKNLGSDFIPPENCGEIRGLQYASFLMAVCHILMVVQEWFFDSNVIRFIHTAERLKPTISNSTEDEFSEHFPHLVMVHNRAQMSDFTPKQVRAVQKTYEMLFNSSKLQFHSDLGLATGGIMNTLDLDNCGNRVNLFIIPDYNESDGIYSGHPPLEYLVKKLRANLFGATKKILTREQLTEKTWLFHCKKAWDMIKTNPDFVQYSKLMP
ncbi:protein SMG9-like isoform X2 [Sitophilus oryzae]|uniref:Protein SMG9-like isoform X2 n=1 Tax=Sitophilus oryzae TaxID=7048 RepID=A0A6J2Y276_SITOR|nr:protein SMG9-like isoform X2 [Sitophilus oryzae]